MWRKAMKKVGMGRFAEGATTRVLIFCLIILHEVDGQVSPRGPAWEGRIPPPSPRTMKRQRRGSRQRDVPDCSSPCTPPPPLRSQRTSPRQRTAATTNDDPPSTSSSILPKLHIPAWGFFAAFGAMPTFPRLDTWPRSHPRTRPGPAGAPPQPCSSFYVLTSVRFLPADAWSSLCICPLLLLSSPPEGTTATTSAGKSCSSKAESFQAGRVWSASIEAALQGRAAMFRKVITRIRNRKGRRCAPRCLRNAGFLRAEKCNHLRNKNGCIEKCGIFQPFPCHISHLCSHAKVGHDVGHVGRYMEEQDTAKHCRCHLFKRLHPRADSPVTSQTLC